MSGFSLDGVTLLFPTVGTRRSQGIGGRLGGVQGLSVSSGPSDSSLWADGGASVAVPGAEAASGVAAGRRVHRGRAGENVGAETAAPESWHAAALAASSKCLEVVWEGEVWGYCLVYAHYRS